MAESLRCINLCCKAMVVYGENFREDPDYQEGLSPFWCSCTAKGIGPDGEHVSLEQCSGGGRVCFEAF